MSHTSKLSLSSKHVQDLDMAEDRFLEVLLSEFDVFRKPPTESHGFQLWVCFDDKTPSIWDNSGRRYLRSIQSSDKMVEYQRKLDAFFFDDDKSPGLQSSFPYRDPDFVFRYASGGTLPIIRFSDRQDQNEYFCLLYREVDPIGWNLPNGGSDNRRELANPQLIIERELQEEIIIADLEQYKRYVFGRNGCKANDLPAHAIARRLWDEYQPTRNLRRLDVVDIRPEWVLGPDSLLVRAGDAAPVKRDGLFININGEDFGIELDRVARMTLPRDAVMFAGEIDRGHLLNCPIGLFNVNNFDLGATPRDLQNTPVRPDFFFFDGALHTGDKIDAILRGPFLKQLRGHLWPGGLNLFEACLRSQTDKCLALCPVTARIILRYGRFSMPSDRPSRPRGSRKQEAPETPGSGVLTPENCVGDDHVAVVGAALNLAGFLDRDPRMRPPSHLTVFKLYCKDSMSAGEIAKRCKCPKSTVMFRMKALKKLLRTDSLLRFRIGTGMFDSFDKVISDSRAKEIYRRGLAEAGERDGDEV